MGSSISIAEATMVHHVGLVLLLLWLLNCFGCCSLFAYFLSFLYLYLVHEKYFNRLKKRLRFEEIRQSYQRRVLSDSETVRWLNHVIENTWPICLEQIVSQKILLPIIPWFMQKYKPWAVKDIVVQHLYLGKSPPLFPEIRVHQSTGDDHLVLELGMNFCTADDMNAILAVKLRKRLGLGMCANLHLLGLHVEGKVLVGVKFIPKWPFIGRLRVCFAEPPYFQMTVKPIFSHGLDVTELPGIAGWVDNIVSLAFEQSLVEPNMLVVDMEKFASPQPENWFSIDVKETIAHVVVEVLEAADIKPSDLNGLADPYLKGRLGPYKFKTKIQWKTLTPKWYEEFKIPVCSWEPPNDELKIEVRDKDHFIDDALGDCSVSISNLRDGQRHDMWLPLQNIKMGRLHITITVVEGDKKYAEQVCDEESERQTGDSFKNDAIDGGTPCAELPQKSPSVEDRYEAIKIEGQQGSKVWVHHPGTEVAQVWESRKGKSRIHDDEIHGEDTNSFGNFRSKGGSSWQTYSGRVDDIQNGNGGGRRNKFLRGLSKISAAFHLCQRNGKVEEPAPSPRPNLCTNKSRVKFIVGDEIPVQSSGSGRESDKGEGVGTPRTKGNAKDKVKRILKHAGSFGCGHSRKGSKKSNGAESKSTPTERDDFFSESDSSDDDEATTTSAVQRTSDSAIDSSNSRQHISGTSNVSSAVNSKSVDRDHPEATHNNTPNFPMEKCCRDNDSFLCS